MYLCMSKGSTSVFPFFSFYSPHGPPNPLKGVFSGRMALQNGLFEVLVRPE